MSTKRILQAVLRTDLVAFIAKVFRTTYPAIDYVPNWHIEAIAHYLMEVTRGNCLRLIINQPPRSLKSLCVSIAYVAWRLGHDPTLRIVVVSYSNELAEELHRQFRLVVSSAWYKELFPNVHIAKDTGTELITSKGGGRLALSVGGSFTGRGADLAIIDDPQKEDAGFSDIDRQRVIEWMTGTFFSRLNDKARTPVILVQQRLHEDDATGHSLRQGGWAHLNLPARATTRQTIPLGNGRFHVFEEGEPLQPLREGPDVLAQIERDKGSLLFSPHYLQEPVSPGGNLIQRKWFRFVDAPPDRKPGVQIVQSWDIASQVGPNNDFSVCLTFLVWQNNYYLIDVWRGRVQFPDLRRKVISHAQSFKATAVLIEDAGAGQALLQDLQRSHPSDMPRPIGRKPDGSKVDRMAAQSAKIEGGQVYLIEKAAWLPVLLNELLAFPYGRHDDQVDALSQFLAWASERRPPRPMVGPIYFPIDDPPGIF